MKYDTKEESEYSTSEDASALPEGTSLKSLVEVDNIASLLSDDVLTKIGHEVVSGYDLDLESREPWFKRYEKAMKLAMQVHEQKTWPWSGAASVKFPLMTLASLTFHARAYPALVPSKNIVNFKVIGRDWMGFKRRRAERVSYHMNYQVMDQMEEWEEDMDRLLITLPITGTEFKKTYWDPSLGRPVSRHVFAKDLVVDYYAKSLDSAERVTEVLSLSPNDIKERERSGLFLQCDLSVNASPRMDKTTQVSDSVQGTTPPGMINGGPREVLEQHTWYDLDGDGYKEPYICTVDRELRKVYRIVARFDSDGVDIKSGVVRKVTPKHYYTKFEFIPSPDGGIYGVGFGTLIYPINESVNSIINQLIDAGTLSNLQSGFISRSFKGKAGPVKFEPGEWKVVNASMQDLKGGIFPLPVREPSGVLFQLLELLVEAGQKVTSTTDILVGENPGQNQKATTTMAVVENGMKVFTAIYKRLRRSLSKELRLLFEVNRVYLDEKEYIRVLDPDGKDAQEMQIYRKDYEDESIDIVPTADPSAVSPMQKIAKAEALLPMIQFGAPVRAVVARYYDALEVENYEELLPPDQSQMPPPPEVVAMMKEQEREDNKLELDANVKLREQARKEIETRHKVRNEITGRHLERDKLDADIMMGSMSEANKAILEREKIKSDKQKQANKPS